MLAFEIDGLSAKARTEPGLLALCLFFCLKCYIIGFAVMPKNKKYILSSRHLFFTKNIFVLVGAVLLIALLLASGLALPRSNFFLPSFSSVYRDWNSGDYLSCREKTRRILAKHPLDGEALALNGFSAYYLFTGQTVVFEEQSFLDEAITSLRKAWYRVADSEKANIAYILGKAYFQKGFYYADLSLKYLFYAIDHGVNYPDIPEFCGLSFSLLEEYGHAAEYFTKALANKPSDLLLFTLAENYAKIPDYAKAKQFFAETMRVTEDDLLKIRCHNALGNIFIAERQFDEAAAEFNAIITNNPNSADAYFGLGLIEEARGDIVRARASWRQALRIDPSHSGAYEKLNN